MSILVKLLLAMIEAGRTEGLAEKIDVFYAAGKITDEEYQMLLEALEA